jgi:hypothetical protein
MRKLWILGVLILAIAAPVHSYITQRDILAGGAVSQIKWPTSNVTWVLDATQGSNVTGARSLSTVMQASFDAWDAVSTANVAFARGADAVSSINAGDNINVVKVNLSPAAYVTAAGSALGLTLTNYSLVTGAILDADIIFDPTISYSTDTVTPGTHYDLQSVATHEIGHMLGLDHSTVLSATMFPRVSAGVSLPRALSSDDIAGVSSIYPTASFLTRGSISGTVRLTSNASVYGAVVVAVDANGQPAAHGVTDPSGHYAIYGLTPGTYTIYAEPMDLPFSPSDQGVLGRIFLGNTISTGFTTRFR